MKSASHSQMALELSDYAVPNEVSVISVVRRSIQLSYGRIGASIIDLPEAEVKENQRAKEREYKRRWNARNRSKAYEYVKTYRAKNHDKWMAHTAVLNALRSGKLTAQPCSICGLADAEAHHDDYTKPLQVRWLCRPHHRDYHESEKAFSALFGAISVATNPEPDGILGNDGVDAVALTTPSKNLLSFVSSAGADLTPTPIRFSAPVPSTTTQENLHEIKKANAAARYCQEAATQEIGAAPSASPRQLGGVYVYQSVPEVSGNSDTVGRIS